MNDLTNAELGTPKVVDRNLFQAQLDALRIHEKAHTRAGDAIAAAVAGCPWSKWMVRHHLLANTGREDC